MKLNWSVFHAAPPDPEVMKRVLARADEYGVEGIEVCGQCHLPVGGLDGCLLFEPYPAASRLRDGSSVAQVRATLAAVAAAAHEAGRPIIYWHREVVLPAGIKEDRPELFDEKGEVDFNGKAYEELLRYKLRAFFRAAPGMDGIVLTLTEAEYSAIHNSDPDRYPPVSVAERIIRTFAEELSLLRKSFTFRTFGSIHEDYRILCTASQRVLKGFRFDVETKITPFDWSLFLPENPYFVRPPGGTLSAEFDLAGEFVGETELPYLNPEMIVRQVRYAREHGCDRLVPRIDRRGRGALGSLSEINLFALSEANRRPDITPEEIWRTWAERKWGAAAPELIPVMQSAIEMLKKSFYIDGHLLSQHPVPTIPMMMLGGIFAVFQPDIPLDIGEHFWSMISTKRSPAREAILSEKAEAVAIADRGAAAIESLAAGIPKDQLALLRPAWHKAGHVTRMHMGIARALVAYFEDMEAMAETPARLDAALADLLDKAGRAASEFPQGLIAEFTEAMRQNNAGFRRFYAAELTARKEWKAMGELADSVVCGGLTDEYRLKRYMHGSAVDILDGRPVRQAANRVFPNGFLEYVMRTVPGRRNQLLLLMHGTGGEAKVTVGDTTQLASPRGRGFSLVELAVLDGTGPVRVRLEKSGAGFPVFGGLAVRAT